MEEYQSLNHTKWDCKYHVVWIPKCRKKRLYGTIKKQLVPVIRELAKQKECEIMEGRMVVDHVHMVISIPPKYAVAQAIGYIKGKSALWVARTCGRKRNFTGQNFCARGYCVSTIGLNDDIVRDYVRRQEEEDRKLDQLKMFEEEE
jgi:putative transposase